MLNMSRDRIPMLNMSRDRKCIKTKVVKKKKKYYRYMYWIIPWQGLVITQLYEFTELLYSEYPWYDSCQVEY